MAPYSFAYCSLIYTSIICSLWHGIPFTEGTNVFGVTGNLATSYTTGSNEYIHFEQVAISQLYLC